MSGGWPSLNSENFSQVKTSGPTDSFGSSETELVGLVGKACTNSSTSAGLANLNQKKPRHSNEAVMLVDRISNLPDSILCFILSFLPTKDAVATSILSRRWKLIWTGVSNLHFGDCWSNKHRCCNYLRDRQEQDKEESVSFAQNIDQVLLLLEAESINKFHLEWPHDNYPFSLDAWVTTAISRNIHVLCIYVCCHHLRIWTPGSLFTCKTLEVLALGGGMSIDDPSSAWLLRLVSLNLESVYYGTVETFCKIISACPVLNSLHIVRYPGDNMAELTIYSSSLRRLEVHSQKKYLSGEIFNRIIPEHKLEIDAPALEYLSLHDRISKDSTIKSSTSLVEADVGVYGRSLDLQQSAFCNSVVELVQGLCCVKFLTLSRDTMKALGSATTHLSVKFPRLTKLKIESYMCEWIALKDLLQCSENLEVLHHFKQDSYSVDRSVPPFFGFQDSYSVDRSVPHDFCWREPNEVPRCLSSSLREISISKLGGFQDELVFVRYILEHGRVMRRMELNATYYVPQERFEILHLISFCTRTFSKFEIVYGLGMPE